MAYRRRFKRRNGGSTGLIKMRFQSFMDLNTKADELQIISISAGGKNILNRLYPQFSAYKYYKIGGVSVKMVPASTLPVDPTGLSIEEGDSTVDPRDQLSPGMCRITNGEDILEDLTGITSYVQRSMYNSMLLDPRWPKFMLQSGFKRYATPRYWQIGQLHQDKWPGYNNNLPALNPGQGIAYDTIKSVGLYGFTATTSETGESASRGIFQVGHRGVLGWLPTDGLSPISVSNGNVVEQPFLASPPEVEVMKIVLPPMHKTEYWYRLFITETVYFKTPVVMATEPYRPVDIFHNPGFPTARLPTTSNPNIDIGDNMTGGNYGDS